MAHVCEFMDTAAETARKKRGGCHKLISISEKNPRSYQYFRSRYELRVERKRHKLTKEIRNIIHPLSTFRMYWEFYMFFVFSSTLILHPLNVVYHGLNHTNIHNSVLAVTATLSDFLCIVDIIMTFFTGYITVEGTVEMRPKLIKTYYSCVFTLLDQMTFPKAYLTSPYFYCDTLSSIPVDIIGKLILKYSSNFEMADRVALYLHMGALLKLLRLTTLIRYQIHMTKMLDLAMTTMLITIIVSCLIIGIHWMACLSYVLPFYIEGHALATASDKRPNSWLHALLEGNLKFDVVYFECLYRTVGIVARLVPSNYAVKTSLEALQSCFNCILATTCHGLILVIVMSIMQTRNTICRNFSIYKDQVKKYMLGKSLPLHLQKRVLREINYVYKGSYFNEHKVKGILSNKLLDDVAIYRGISFLHDTFITQLPPDDMRYAICHMREEIYSPNETVVKAGTGGDSMYFIASGTVCVISPAGREICHLQNGDYFGEIAIIFKGHRRKADVQALEHCLLYRMDRKTFNTKVAIHEQIFNNLSTIAKQRMTMTEQLNIIHLQFISRMQEEKLMHDAEGY